MHGHVIGHTVSRPPVQFVVDYFQLFGGKDKAGPGKQIQFEVARIRASELLELYAQLVQAPWIESEASTRSSPKQSHHS